MNWAGDELICEHRDIKATAAAIDCTGRFLVLAGRLGTSVIDLTNPQSVLRKINRKSRWEVSVVGWNHHPEFRHVIAIGSNQKVEILNFEYSVGELVDNGQAIKGLERSVLDLDWNISEPGLLVTCSVDNYVNIWDMRDLRRPVANLPSVCGASQSKWSKIGSKPLLATAHEADCKIWDFRKASTPMEYIAAHSAKINGLDWSGNSANSLVTCAQDCTVKVWDITTPKKAEHYIQVTAPVWRARFTPFGESVVTVGIPQIHRGDTSLTLWALNDTSSPIHIFSGHTEGIYDFFWRSPRNHEYQMVSWSKDQSLRLWKTDSSVQKQCGAAYLNHTIVLDHPHYEGHLSHGREHYSMTSLLSSEANGVSPPGSPVSSLDRELKSVDLPNVVVDDIDVKLRTCVVMMTSGPHLVRISLSFPLGYPENSTPNFQVTQESTTLNPMSVRQIGQALTDTFARCLKNQSVSVVPAIRSAMQFLGTLSTDASPSPRLDPHPVFISPPSQQPPVATSAGATFKVGAPTSRFSVQRVESPLISAATAKLLGNPAAVSFPTDTVIPFPRICGLCFAGDKLLMWSDHWKLGNSGGGTKSTLSGNLSGIYPSELSSRQRQVRKALKKKGKAERPTITIYSVENLLPFHPILAANYKNDSFNPVESFRFNAELAESVGRQDLAYVWNLLSVVMYQPACDYGTELRDEATWSAHPFGRALLDYLIERYRGCADSSFLATLLCILCRLPCSQKQRGIPSSRNHKSASHLGGVVSPHHTLHAEDCVDGWTLSPAVTSSVRDKRANSWTTPSWDATRKQSAEDARDLADRYILHPDRKQEFDLFKREYCEHLYGARLLNKRAEIMKCLGDAAEPHRGVEYYGICHNCRLEVRGSRCFRCKYIATTCIICHIPVRGMSSFCIVCGHGGHSTHMQNWFATNAACPSGCGCLCLEAMKTASV
ncbi:WD repeat-containing protein 59 [Hypsibius exemplaris]|uniref:WD repeat-containing protein 59 n=1 Tax=Hypsibius exemplaris TaxID=2072580 RepID=A0A1W0WB79_HYPEX|nr:WD repeat-containing protein 59 [Hypsibius exemplaris]